MRAAVLATVMLGLTSPLGAQTCSVAGQAGMLGERELAATVTEQADSGGQR